MSDSVITLSRFRTELGKSLARRGKKLLEAENLPERVAELTPLEGYFVVKELGSDTALPILSHFNEEQFQTLIDIDGWHGAEPQLEDVDAWLGVYRSLGNENLAGAFLMLDAELQTLLLRGMLTVWDPKLDAIPEPNKDARRKDTADGFFHIEAKEGTEWEIDPFDLVDALYRHDLGEGTRQMLAARTEQDTFLAEEAYRFRSGRLEDWGFPDRERAMRIFAAPDPGEPDAERSAPKVFVTIPALYAAPMSEGTLFVRAMNGVEDEGLIRSIQEELVFLVNAAVVGYGAGLRDIDHVVSITERVRDGVNLGLEALTRDQVADERPAKARSVIASKRLESIFQTGQAELQTVARSARALASDPIIENWLAREETDDDEYKQEKADRAFLRRLVEQPPLVGGYDRVRPDKVRMPGLKDAFQALACDHTSSFGRT
ncbi:MAG: DUF6178 family protein, partial [Myxococcota bacterium]